jgi:V8-like Glu-specific endopeptidase
MARALFRAAASRLIAIGVLASLAPVTALARIVGADDRTALPNRLEAPLSGVGRLVCRDPESGERFSTTATLVGNRSTLLAAGHYGRVQMPGRSSMISIEYCAFELRSADGRRLFGSLVTPQSVARFSARAQPDPLTPDWAILKLRTAAPAFVSPILMRPIAAGDLSRRSNVFMVSYHSRPEALARLKRYSPACKPLPVSGEPLVFRHSCDTEAGSSGGLLYINPAAGPRAVGINHGSATDREWNYGQVISSDMIGHLPKEGVDAAP